VYVCLVDDDDSDEAVADDDSDSDFSEEEEIESLKKEQEREKVRERVRRERRGTEVCTYLYFYMPMAAIFFVCVYRCVVCVCVLRWQLRDFEKRRTRKEGKVREIEESKRFQGAAAPPCGVFTCVCT